MKSSMIAPARHPDFCVSIPPVLVPVVASGSRPVDLRAERDGMINGIPIPEGALLAIHGIGLSLLHPPSDLRIGPCVFRGGTTIAFHAGLAVASGVLAEGVEIGGLPCAADAALRLDARGSVREATLARDHAIEGFVAAAGTTITLLDGRLCTFEPVSEMKIDGIQCAARRPVHLARRSPTATPTLYSATLARDQEIAGVPCAGGRTVTMLGGRLHAAWLSRSFVVGGLRFRAGTPILGELPQAARSGTLDEEAVIDGVPCAAGAEIRRSSSDELTRFTLARDHVIDGIACLAGQAIRTRRDPDGFRYVLAAPHRMRGVQWQRGDVLRRDTDEIFKVLLASPRRLGGVEVPAGSDVEITGFFRNRYEVKLGAALEVDGQRLEAGAWAAIRRGRWQPAARPAPPARPDG
ncbi:hypothetical protein [Sorangium sp. So ce1389]|uniref:hypothetical protein n=1 Tax=Sorangium sp. So ce1389 TaxID=3133336 RepID=UPI003F60F13E